MKDLKDQISAEYLSTLILFLSGKDDVALQRGYEMGRSALDSGHGLLEVAEAYVVALTEILTPLTSEGAGLTASTQELLSTSLAPYEMTHRGYQDSISKLKKMNMTLERQTEELTAANRELEAFSYTVSHDLRSPMAGIASLAQIILDNHGKQLDEKGREYISEIIDSALQTGQLIEGLLSLAQFSRQELVRSSVDLSKIARTIIRNLQNENPKRQVSIAIAENATVDGDGRLLQAAMTNLLMNAWKFTALTKDAKIEFGVTMKDGKPVYFVKDNGAGFDMKNSDKLFKPFQRLHSTSQFKGTGIGLATVRRVVERHGGKIWVEAQVNQGATFYFTL